VLDKRKASGHFFFHNSLFISNALMQGVDTRVQLFLQYFLFSFVSLFLLIRGHMRQPFPRHFCFWYNYPPISLSIFGLRSLDTFYAEPPSVARSLVMCLLHNLALYLTTSAQKSRRVKYLTAQPTESCIRSHYVGPNVEENNAISQLSLRSRATIPAQDSQI
jgi:hypothetical protein